MMNFSINSFIKLATFSIILIFSLFLYLLTDLHSISKELTLIEKNKYLMVFKVAELSQSSDNLTRFSRLYVITSDIQYRDNYYKVLDIRRGEAKKPKEYNKLYWDLLEPKRSQLHPNGKKTSLKEEMELLPYSQKQKELIELSFEKSNELIKVELTAFKYMDNHQQNKAIEILHSQEYNKAKEKIFIPIDKFMLSIKKNVRSKITLYKAQIEMLFNKVFIILFVGLFLLFCIFIILRKKIMIPIHILTRSILSFKTGGNDFPQTIIYDDEIGMMTKQFYLMKKKLDEKYEAVKKLSLTDSLTKIKNRRSFFEISEEYIKLAGRRDKPVSLMILDIDFFKNVNDTYGHVIGDEILKFLVKTVKLTLRDSDIFARYGGEEFIILLPNTDLQNALLVAEKIRSKVQTTQFKNSEASLFITISIGVKQLSDEKLIRELIKNADELLYKAKENGRNRVES